MNETQYRQLYKKIYSKLMSFDDTDLGFFCLEYHTNVIDKFSDNMTRDRKIYLLIKYCRRRPEEFEELAINLKIIPKKPRPSAAVTQSAKPAYQAIMPHNFDLRDLIEECVDCLLEQEGIIGFGLPYSSPTFVTNFCERLKQERGRNLVKVKDYLMVNPVHTPLDDVLLTIKRRYLPALQHQHILFAVQIPNATLAREFWQRLQTLLNDKAMPHNLIVIITLTDNGQFPKELKTLRPPQFRRAHAQFWIRQIVEQRAWPDTITELWVKHMIVECQHGQGLHVDWVYDHLKDMLKLFHQNPTLEDFKTELARRRKLYA